MSFRVTPADRFRRMQLEAVPGQALDISTDVRGRCLSGRRILHFRMNQGNVIMEWDAVQNCWSGRHATRGGEPSPAHASSLPSA